MHRINYSLLDRFIDMQSREHVIDKLRELVKVVKTHIYIENIMYAYNCGVRCFDWRVSICSLLRARTN